MARNILNDSFYDDQSKNGVIIDMGTMDTLTEQLLKAKVLSQVALMCDDFLDLSASDIKHYVWALDDFIVKACQIITDIC